MENATTVRTRTRTCICEKKIKCAVQVLSANMTRANGCARFAESKVASSVSYLFPWYSKHYTDITAAVLVVGCLAALIGSRDRPFVMVSV